MSKIKVVQLARIPTANSPLSLSNLLNDFSRDFESRHILGSMYSKKFPDTAPYREFPYDLFWETNKEDCLKVIKQADIIHIHHGFWHDQQEIVNLFKGKKVVFSVCDLSLGTNLAYFNNVINQGWLMTVYDQPAQKQMFSKYSSIFLPLVNCHWEIIEKNNKVPHVVFAPTNRQPITTPSSKGYKEVLAIINKLKGQGLQFTFDLIEGVPYLDNIERKKKLDIIIDDIVHDTFHNSAIEAVCFGGVSITGYSGKDYPFIKANINTLEQTLVKLISEPEYLAKEKARLQEWRKIKYNPFKLIEFYDKFYHKVLENTIINSPIEMSMTEVKDYTKIEPIKISLQEAYDSFLTLINLLQSTRVCLMTKTCLQLLRCELSLNTKEFFIAIEQIELIKDVVIKKGYKFENNKIIKDKLVVNLLPFPENFKPWTIGKENVNVPCPVTKYLRKLYGDGWEKK